MEESLADIVEHIIYKAEFNSGGSEDEKFDNSVATRDMIEQYANQRVIEELEKILTQDNLPTVYINKRIKELKQ